MGKVSLSPDGRYVRVVWAIVLVATILRLVAAARLPLSGDEAYYWEWSRRLAPGYIDHPPMVAWLIAAFSLGLRNTLLIRLPFVLCGLGAALLLNAFVVRATGDARGGATAALLLSLAPFASIAFTVASPDGPFLFFWSLSLYLALRSIEPSRSALRLPLALCIAAATLSRILGLLLAAGVAIALGAGTRRSKAYSVGATLLFVAALLPYILWDAAHGWIALRFALVGRHDATYHGGNILPLLGIYAAVLTPGLFVATGVAIARLARRASPAESVLWWTAALVLGSCLLLSLREPVEFYWADGAFVSLIAAVGLYASRLLRGVRYWLVLAPAAIVAGLLLIVAAMPLETYAAAQALFGIRLEHQGPFEIWAFEPAARDVAREARSDRAWVMTDGYGLSSVLDFYADVPPVVIGYDRQGREAQGWALGPVPSTAIFFDKEALATRPDFVRQLHLACKTVTDEGERKYYRNGLLARSFYLTRCDGLTPAGFALLRWSGSP